MRIVFEPDQYKDLYIIFDNSEKELIFTEDSDGQLPTAESVGLWENR